MITALICVVFGAFAIMTGVWILFGFAWALIFIGLTAAALGLAVVDVEDRKTEGKTRK